MDIRKNLKIIFYIWLMFFSLIFPCCRQLFGNDKVLDYSLDLIKDQKVEVRYDDKGNVKSISSAVIDFYYIDLRDRPVCPYRGIRGIYNTSW